MDNVKKNSDINDVDSLEIKENLSSITLFFTIAYGIILALSMSYNIGYFKYLNPQLVDLMTLEDYIDDTTHNIWLFLLAALIFLASSLASVRNHIKGQLPRIIFFAACTLMVSIYSFCKKITYSKFWPTLKALIVTPDSLPILAILLALMFIISLFLLYRITFQLIKKDITLPLMLGWMPIILFLCLVLIPYVLGIMHGYIESTYLTKNDYHKQSVEIKITPGEQILKDVFIVKKINDGLILKQFLPNSGFKHSPFFFLNWNNIEQIFYADIE